MTPCEELKAARARLEELRAKADPGPWGIEADDYAVEDGTELAIVHSSEMADIGNWMGLESAKLIVALHRTIDTQMSILTEALDDYEAVLVGDCAYPPLALRLARSINGVSQQETPTDSD
ncbi:hypothetical protein [Curtobacterium sp. MCSS17_015]|uniref:hypothetical protein n=1 Tax=Curtobacterium sp. MCSS17_015 TaxID=2175666 RepID=UPI000DA92178|nr:hypothetical protein [Curtobacterium sp. MCSS17_015]WIB25831.1 hypothetical protein DEJ18_12345 [Curtobacterium sp. MCSS17_015]